MTPEALREHLLDLDVSAAVLRRDPSGRTWLPADLRNLVEADGECKSILRQFIAVELELFDEADVGSDPFFTARVLQSLPPATEVVRPWRRTAILAVFHGLGVAAAYATAWVIAPAQLVGWVDQAHLWVDQGWVSTGPWTMVAVTFAALVALLVALAAPRPDTPTA